MLLEREVGRIHAERLSASRHRHRPRRNVRSGLADSLHRLADRLDQRSTSATDGC